MQGRYIIGIDEGTTSARAGVYDTQTKKLVKIHSVKLKQYYPHPGWVEEDAEAIYRAVYESLRACVGELDASQILGMGITNQRETVIAWDRETGEPACRAIVWQCRRTAERCNNLSNIKKKIIQAKTGLIPDAYFSATKMEWLLKNEQKVKSLAKSGRLCFGTIDSFLAFRLCGRHVTDATNASRTMLYNIYTNDWDDELLDMFGVKKQWLPKIISCDEVVGEATVDGKRIKVAGMIGDQQSALFGQACFKEGMVKNTYGTGCFMLMNVGSSLEKSPSKLLTTVAYKLGKNITYALEGSVFNAGSIISWFMDELELISSPTQTQKMATSIEDNGGVYFVPALTGLGAPYWDGKAKASFMGLTRGSTKNHMVRAGLESMAYSTMDILKEMSKYSAINDLRCDGGVSRNTFLMQYQADLCEKTIRLPLSGETTLMGAIFMCGLALKYYKSIKDIEKEWRQGAEFSPQKNSAAKKSYEIWKRAVKATCSWRD